MVQTLSTLIRNSYLSHLLTLAISDLDETTSPASASAATWINPQHFTYHLFHSVWSTVTNTHLAIVHHCGVKKKSVFSNWSILLLVVQMYHISVFSRLLWVVVESLVCHLTSAWNPKKVITFCKIVFPLQHVGWFVPSDLLSAQTLFSGHTNCTLAA